MSVPWWDRLDRWKKGAAAGVFLAGLLAGGVLFFDDVREAVEATPAFRELEDTTHRHFGWAEQHDVQHDEEHREFLEAADTILHRLDAIQTQQMMMDARQRWMECDEKMEDDIAAGRIPRDCPPEIVIPGVGGGG